GVGDAACGVGEGEAAGGVGVGDAVRQATGDASLAAPGVGDARAGGDGEGVGVADGCGEGNVVCGDDGRMSAGSMPRRVTTSAITLSATAATSTTLWMR
ncbi:MAG: hypothetical protein EB084_26420, partial [Proteobacteria bacterium]|nr:hypothetical protein [Pseudomonadota bacterium]